MGVKEHSCCHENQLASFGDVGPPSVHICWIRKGRRGFSTPLPCLFPVILQNL